MLRYQALDCAGLQADELFTLDLDVPELEKQLTRGGYGESGYERVSLAGVEVHTAPDSAKEERTR
jgi:hypothetical protein